MNEEELRRLTPKERYDRIRPEDRKQLRYRCYVNDRFESIFSDRETALRRAAEWHDLVKSMSDDMPVFVQDRETGSRIVMYGIGTYSDEQIGREEARCDIGN